MDKATYQSYGEDRGADEAGEDGFDVGDASPHRFWADAVGDKSRDNTEDSHVECEDGGRNQVVFFPVHGVHDEVPGWREVEDGYIDDQGHNGGQQSREGKQNRCLHHTPQHKEAISAPVVVAFVSQGGMPRHASQGLIDVQALPLLRGLPSRPHSPVLHVCATVIATNSTSKAPPLLFGSTCSMDCGTVGIAP